MSKNLRLFFITFFISTSLFAAGENPSLVEVAKVKKGEINPLQKFIGTIYYGKNSNLASKESGVVKEVKFSEGDKVEQGEILFVLDSALLNAKIKEVRGSVNALKADFTNQEKEYKRLEKLYKKRSVSEQQFDKTRFAYEKLKSQYDSSKASLESLLIQKANRSIKAPFSGVVTTKKKEVGEWVNTGESVASIVDTSDLEIKLNIPARFINFLNKDSLIKSHVGNLEVETQLKSLVPLADIKTRTFPVKLKILNPEGLIEGMSISVSLPAMKKAPALLVPRDALIKKFGQEVVFVANDGVANMVPVKVIGLTRSKIAITGQGIVPGGQVIVKGNERIFPNSPIQIIGQ